MSANAPRSSAAGDAVHDRLIHDQFEALGKSNLPDHDKAGYPINDFRQRMADFDAHFRLMLAKLRSVRGTAPAKVLDVGCGNGAFTSLVIDETRSVYGVDYSESLIRQARERCPSARLCVASCYGLPFAEKSFDLT